MIVTIIFATATACHRYWLNNQCHCHTKKFIYMNIEVSKNFFVYILKLHKNNIDLYRLKNDMGRDS